MKNKMLYKVCRSGIFAAIICVLSFINFPFGAVSVSMATLGIMLVGCVLPPLESAMSSVTYILIGVIGIPVFSGGSGGIGVLFGPTGGYIWSYPLLAAIVSAFCQIRTKKKSYKYIFAFIGCLVGSIICYTLGAFQYTLVTGSSAYMALFVCVIPFVPIDVLKMVCACVIGLSIKTRLFGSEKTNEK